MDYYYSKTIVSNNLAICRITEFLSTDFFSINTTNPEFEILRMQTNDDLEQIINNQENELIYK